jgi:hypothetical protein
MTISFGPDEIGKGFGKSKENFVCPSCNVLSLHLLLDVGHALEYDCPQIKVEGTKLPGIVKRQHLIYVCVGCSAHTYFLRETVRVPGASGFTHVIHQFPVADISVKVSLPKDLKNAMRESELCLAIGAYNACGTMTRRAMHAICADKRATGKVLYEQLLDLKTKNIMTPDLWEWAEELRIVGRSGAHPEWEDVSPDDAQYAVNFLREIVRYIYINPRERAEKRLKDTKKKKPEQTSTSGD